MVRSGYGLVTRQKLAYSSKVVRIFAKLIKSLFRRYCLLNDSDTELTPEAAFSIYGKQMRDYGDLPLLCRARKRLVDRLLLDLQASANFDTMWNNDWLKNKQHGIHLIFFATPSGMIRFINESLDDLGYEEPAEQPNSYFT
jgi:hypothetical protein